MPPRNKSIHNRERRIFSSHPPHAELRAKAMFGAHGLYCGDKFFGILDEGRLFFKTDTASQADFTERGMGPFTYEMKGKVMTMAYHEVPPDVLENAPELTA